MIREIRALTVVALTAAHCSPAPQARAERGPEMTAQLAADVAAIRRRRIYFYHHSVGQNVLDGLARLDGEVGGGTIRMVARDAAAGIAGPVLAHGGGGRNGDPKGKIDFFAEVIRKERGLNPDLAFLKLCYADIDPRTDVADVFDHYRRTLQGLAREFPGIRFAHVTVPLMEHPEDLKNRIYRVIGREVWADASNVKRAEFNRRLLEAFPTDPILDLARIEATRPDGGQSTFEAGGRRYPGLYAGYSEDGGHLNAAGQRVAAVEAARFMAAALDGAQAAR